MQSDFPLPLDANGYVKAKTGDDTTDSPEDWLDGFNTFSIYQVLSQLIQLWGLNTQTEIDSKKTSPN